MRFKWGSTLALLGLGATAAVAVAVSSRAGTDSPSSDVVGPVVKGTSHSAATETASDSRQPDGHFDLNSIRRDRSNRVHTSSLLEPKSWYVPPPPPRPTPASSLPPPPPSAPQLPFTYIGRMVDGRDVILFLLRNDTEYAVRAYDVLDDKYRVERITENEAVLTYLPLNTQQVLRLNTDAQAMHLLSGAASSPAGLPTLPGQAQQRPNLTLQTQ